MIWINSLVVTALFLVGLCKTYFKNILGRKNSKPHFGITHSVYSQVFIATPTVVLCCKLCYALGQLILLDKGSCMPLEPSVMIGSIIQSEFILHMGSALKSWFLDFLTSCLRQLKILKIWRRALIVAIPKPEKALGYPKSFRSASLLIDDTLSTTTWRLHANSSVSAEYSPIKHAAARQTSLE